MSDSSDNDELFNDDEEEEEEEFDTQGDPAPEYVKSKEFKQFVEAE